MSRMLLISTICIFLTACTSLGSGPAPVYGCWCGKNQPSSDENPTPVDFWDQACMRHDLCYRRYGRDNPGCDLSFLKEIEKLALWHGHVPGQMQVAHSYFLSRLQGGFNVQGWFTARDIEIFYEAGEDHLCGY